MYSTENNSISAAEIYGIHYLDNGGNLDDFPKKEKELHKAIEEEEKRRLMVTIRYNMNDSAAFKKKIYKKIKVSEKTNLQPKEIYASLGKLSTKQLLTILHPRKE